MSTLDTLQAALTFHRERHTVLAGNIANLDTPGYKPLDLQRTTPVDGTQLATTAEGFLTVPFVADYARTAARLIPDDLLCDELKGQPAHARPVPCYVLFRPAAERSTTPAATSPRKH